MKRNVLGMPAMAAMAAMTAKAALSALVLAALLLGGSGSAAARAAGLAAGAEEKSAAGVEVKIDNFTYAPAELHVRVGSTVTWVNRDDIPHTVVSVEKVFKSKVLDTDEEFAYVFAKAGTFPYFCSIHPKMTGTVIVQ